MTGHLSYESATDSYLWYREKTSSRFRFIRRVSVKEALWVGLVMTILDWVPNPGTGFHMGPDDSWIVIILLSVLLIFPAWALLYFGVRKLLARVVTSAVRRRFLDSQGLLWGNYVLSPGSIALGRITYFTPTLEAVDSPHGRIYRDGGRYVVGGLPEAAAESTSPVTLPNVVTGHLSTDSAVAAWAWYRTRISRYLRFLQRSSWKELLGVGLLLTALVTLLAPGVIAPQFRYGNVVASGFWVGLPIRWSLLLGLYTLLKWRWARMTAKVTREHFLSAEGIMWGPYEMTADSVRFAKITFHLAGCQAFDSPYGRIFVDAGRYRTGGFPPGGDRVADPLSAMISPPPTAQSRRRKRSLLILLVALAVIVVIGAQMILRGLHVGV